MIPPTIGRVVWYRPSAYDRDTLRMTVHSDAQPFKADVIYVWSDNCVNLDVTDHQGAHFIRTSVPINLPADPVFGGYAEWMPYQLGQAKKAEAEKGD